MMTSNLVVPLDSERMRQQYGGGNIVLIMAVGFEARAVGFLKRLRAANVRIGCIIAVQYPNRELNEPARTEIEELARAVGKEVKDLDVAKIADLPGLVEARGFKQVLCDISAMDRISLFEVLQLI